ncbi:hypothetical protein, partial [Enterococcus casseliflavus]|uniref:hypothetical protein n=1 Tax=Enterococcus casseliflavus TaxID=37734 RepID=UPI003D0B5E84
MDLIPEHGLRSGDREGHAMRRHQTWSLFAPIRHDQGEAPAAGDCVTNWNGKTSSGGGERG